MLYDVFICHASEDKDAFVRPLAEALQAQHIEVWYDEFALTLGDSIRQAVDRGLTSSRFGVIVLSPAFFAKSWPQYELDGLVDREMTGGEKVILPIWHEITHDEVAQYSPTLAGRKAVQSSDGIEAVATAISQVVRPDRSPLIIARDIAIDFGLTPPVITDKYWLEVTEASNRIPAYGAVIPEVSHWGRWSFPLPPKDGTAEAWGERLAWTAMQEKWVQAADNIPITINSHPIQVHRFLLDHPGLLDTCATFPDLLAEYAPQITIPGFEGPLESEIRGAYEASVEKRDKLRAQGSGSGSALTTDGQVPRCDIEWAFQDPEFGNYKAENLAHSYFHPDGVFGPPVDFYSGTDNLFWLLSAASDWLPPKVKRVLLDGVKDWGREWRWGEYDSIPHDSEQITRWSSYGALEKEILATAESRKRLPWSRKAIEDCTHKIAVAKQKMNLPEEVSELLIWFRDEQFAEAYLEQVRRQHRRSSSRKTRS